MPALAEPPPSPTAAPPRTVEDLLRDLGDVPAFRVRLRPAPGTATEADLLALGDEGKCCELIDGVVVEKAMSYAASFLAGLIYRMLCAVVHDGRLGHVTGPDAQFRLRPGSIRLPDVGVTPLAQLPATIPPRGVADWAPALSIEVLSPSNRPGELLRKRRELFAAGCVLFWEFDPQTRALAVYTAPDGPPHTVGPGGTLDGTAVVPGLLLPLPELYAEWDALQRLHGGN